MRLFIALELPDPVLEHLLGMQERLRPLAPGVRWTPREHLHVTLKFLGETPDGRVPAVCDALERAIGDGADAPREAGTPATESLFIGAPFCLPGRGPVRILAAGIDGDLAPLRALFGRIERELKPLGFPLEHRPLLPHITLARARTPLPGSLRRTLSPPDPSSPASPAPVRFQAQRVTLFQSILERRGATYAAVVRYHI